MLLPHSAMAGETANPTKMLHKVSCYGTEGMSSGLQLSWRGAFWEERGFRGLQTGQAAQGNRSEKKSWLRQLVGSCFGNSQCRETCSWVGFLPLFLWFHSPPRITPHTLPAGEGSNAAAPSTSAASMVRAWQKALRLWFEKDRRQVAESRWDDNPRLKDAVK